MASFMLQALRPADFTSSGQFTQRSKRIASKGSNMEFDNNAVAKVLKEVSDSDMFAEAPTASTTSTAKARAGSLSIGRSVKSQPHRVQVLDVDPHLTARRGLHDATAATSRAKPAATVTTVGGRRRLETTSLLGVKRPGPVEETISTSPDAEQPVKKKKRKSVSWAPDHKLCDVLLFYKDDSRPPQHQAEAPTHEEPVDGPPGFEAAARMEHDQERAWHQRHTQDHVIQEQLRMSHHQQQERKSALAKQSGGRSREEERSAYEALQPQLSWRQPEQLQLLEEWGVAAGGDSVERQNQQARESSTPGVVYHSLSEMPTSPVEAGDEPMYSESSVTQIPLISVEDDTQVSAQAPGPEQTQLVSASPSPHEEEPVPQPSTAPKVETPQPVATAAQASSAPPQVSASSSAAQAGPPISAPTAAEVSGLTNLLTTISQMQAPQGHHDLAAPNASSVASVLAALCSQLPTQQPPQAPPRQAQLQAQTQGQAHRQPQPQPQLHQQPPHQMQPQHSPVPPPYPSTYVRPQQLPEPAQLSLPQPHPLPQRPPAHGSSAQTSAPPKLMTAAQQVAAALSGNSIATNIDPQLLMQLLSNPTLMADLTKTGGSSSAAKVPLAPNLAATMPPVFPANPPSMNMFQPPSSNPPPGLSGPGGAGGRPPPPLPPGPRPPSVEFSRPFGHPQMLPSPFRTPPGPPGPGFRPGPAFQHAAGPPLPFEQHMRPPHLPFRPGGPPPPPHAHLRPEQHLPPFESPPPPLGMCGGNPFPNRQKRDPVSKVICKFFNTPMGCRNGEHCQFLHEPWGP